MKENLRRLQLIFRLTRLKPEMFYCISVTNYEITLQGYADIVLPMCNQLKFEMSSFDRRQFERDGINLSLVAA